MNTCKHLFCAFLALAANMAWGENSRDLGDYIVHYNALSTTSLSKTVAQSYGITRSKNRGMLNVTIMKKQADQIPQAATALVTAHATNLNNQIKNLSVREIREQDAIYYIAEFGIDDGESLRFTINVAPENEAPQTIRFDKQFFAN